MTEAATVAGVTIEGLNRELAEHEAGDLLALGADLDWDTWTPENLLGERPGKWELSLVAHREGEAVAYAISSRKGDDVHLHHIVVAQAYRGSGLGAAMLARLRADVRPELVLVPSVHDIHQDHGTIANEAIRAFKNVSMLGYEMPWNNLSFETTSFVLLDEADVARKIEALSCYESQRNRPYASADFLRSLARTRGTQIGTTYAEAFQVIRWVIT